MIGQQGLADLIREDLTESEETAQIFLRQSWLSRASSTLWDMRHRADLTQAKVAERMGTTQSAVARWERDDEGGMSLRRFIDFALACGMLPMDLEFRPLADMRGFVLQHPESPRTASAYELTRLLINDKTYYSGANEFAGFESLAGALGNPSPFAQPFGQLVGAALVANPEFVSLSPLRASSHWSALAGAPFGEQRISQQDAALVPSSNDAQSAA